MKPENETKINGISGVSKPRMKVYSILSVKKDLPDELIRDRVFISLVSAFSTEDAVNGNRKALVDSGRMTDEWNGAWMVAWDYIENLLPIPQFPAHLLKKEPEVKLQEPSAKDKSIEQLSSYVRYVFEHATAEEKEIAENVITKFKDLWMRPKKTTNY